VREVVLVSAADTLAEVATGVVALVVIDTTELALIRVDESDATGVLDGVVTRVDEGTAELVGDTTALVVVGAADEVGAGLDDGDGVGEATDDTAREDVGLALDDGEAITEGLALALGLALGLALAVGAGVPVSLPEAVACRLRFMSTSYLSIAVELSELVVVAGGCRLRGFASDISECRGSVGLVQIRESE